MSDTNLKIEDIKYLALEGGGGKGVAYIGAFEVLNKVSNQALGRNFLPVRKTITTSLDMKAVNKTQIQIAEPHLKGISGASTGSITAFFITIGCDVEDIRNEADSGAFAEFLDLPSKGVYRMVNSNAAGDIEVGYGVDDAYFIRDLKTKKNNGNDATFYNERDLQIYKDKCDNDDLLTIPGRYFFSEDDVFSKYINGDSKIQAEEKGLITTFRKRRYRTKAKGLITFNRPFIQLAATGGLIIDAITGTGRFTAPSYSSPTIKIINNQIPNSQTVPVQEIINALIKQSNSIYPASNVPDDKEKERSWGNYLSNLFNDRGLFPGFTARSYFYRTMKKYLVKHDPSSPYFIGKNDNEVNNEIKTMTFKKLYDITGINMIITSVNITKTVSLPFSYQHTPDFPVVEAVCMSMCLPMVFKPIYNNADVKFGASKEYNERYKGFFIDGGTVVNLPLHAFDDGFELNKNVLALRLQNGHDPNELFDVYSQYPDYDAYLKTLKRKGIFVKKSKEDSKINTLIPKNKYIRDFYNVTSYPLYLGDALGSFGSFVGDLLSALMYYEEEGQIKNEKEAKQTIPLYAYDVTIYDFDPDPNLKKFVIGQAREKTAAYFNISLNEKELDRSAIGKKQ